MKVKLDAEEITQAIATGWAITHGLPRGTAIKCATQYKDGKHSATLWIGSDADISNEEAIAELEDE